MREQFKDEKVFISLGFDGCIDVRNEEEWLKWTEKVASTGQATPEGRALTRKIMSMSDETTFDNAGRIKISSILQNKASITKGVVVIGNNDHLEVMRSASLRKLYWPSTRNGRSGEELWGKNLSYGI
ncbi:division/cell wall cluster transcriptional repressor MraZ [Spiroplasma endosymbiont of Phyllotreta cruciferae]|uniref:division/cell wall cluster transcriptional repressor MraZ n=1 Tax=Spiroplasma endosymbiont of Phyllotreta cruciferae TaxID=2886375 RepID=UPI00209CE3C3|nr:hypothetical protein [Spiroplasma endosymbiont of Phyllotreta cruciferae]